MSPEPTVIDVVASFDFDAEEVWIGEDLGNADRPGTLSQGPTEPRWRSRSSSTCWAGWTCPRPSSCPGAQPSATRTGSRRSWPRATR